ncbi:MAG: DoxX family protein, partial [Bacteroidota bacterium]
FHNPAADPSQMTQFMKNLAIIGGLLMVLAFGSGPVSLEPQPSFAKE